MRGKRSAFPALLGVAALVVCGTLLADKGNVDELRLGTALDASGEIDSKAEDHSFPDGVTIYASMRIHDAKKGTPVMLTVTDRESNETVFSESQPNPGGHSKISFAIADAKLNPGEYRVKVKLGDDWVAEREFEVEGG